MFPPDEQTEIGRGLLQLRLGKFIAAEAEREIKLSDI